MKFAEDVDLLAIAKMIPRNFTGADFSALTSESYMIAVKQKISQVQKDIESWKEKQGLNEDIMPETYLKLAIAPEQQQAATQVLVTQDNLEQALSQVIPSISLEELEKYETLRRKYTN